MCVLKMCIDSLIWVNYYTFLSRFRPFHVLDIVNWASQNRQLIELLEIWNNEIYFGYIHASPLIIARFSLLPNVCVGVCVCVWGGGGGEC